MNKISVVSLILLMIVMSNQLRLHTLDVNFCLKNSVERKWNLVTCPPNSRLIDGDCKTPCPKGY